LVASDTNLVYNVDNVNNKDKTHIANFKRSDYMEYRNHNGDKAEVKEQVSFRIAAEVKDLMERIASGEHRTIANLTEKLVLERLRELDYLDENFQPIKKE